MAIDFDAPGVPFDSPLYSFDGGVLVAGVGTGDPATFYNDARATIDIDQRATFRAVTHATFDMDQRVTFRSMSAAVLT